jgi:5-formyltetrahydrofolate cyclo-ligase
LRQKRQEFWKNRAEHQRLSILAQEALLASRLWSASPVLVLFLAIRDEISTSLLLRRGLEQGKPVYVPRCRGCPPGIMSLRRFREEDSPELSRMGIPEPPASAMIITPEDLERALIVVPGLAFDAQGFRLGYGGGYYDRLLAGPHGKAVGLCFQMQLVDEVPREPWDRAVDALATEGGLQCL